MEILKKSYYIIFSILIIILSIYFCTHNTELKSFSLNLITEILGIFITVFLIDYVIQEREKKEKQKILQSAFHQFKRPIREILGLLVIIYKSTCKSKPEDLKKTYKEILSTDDFYKTIKYLDFMKKAPITPTANWANYITHTVKSFNGSIDKIIDKYAFVLDSKMITEMESINNSSILQILASSEIILKSDISMNFSRENLPILANDDIIDDLKDFLDKVFHLIEYFENQAEIHFELNYDEGIWGENIAPKIGTGRVSLRNEL
jgi:hypothetical protein